MAALFAVDVRVFLFVVCLVFFGCFFWFCTGIYSIHMAMYSIKDAWNMTVLAPTIVSAVIYSELLTGQKIW